jgi:hypothetical protein
MKQLRVQLRYKPKSGDLWKYKMTQKSTMKLPTAMPNMPQGNASSNMEMDVSATLKNRIEKVENDEIELNSSIDNLQISMNVAGMKQNLPIPDIQKKMFSSKVSNLGKQLRQPDFSSISGESMLGSESMFSQVGSGFVSTLPIDTVRVGDKWVEPINKEINLGSIGKMNLNGRIRYSLLGFENMAKYPCAKIEGKFEDIRMAFNGNIKPAPDKPAQTMNMNAMMNGTGLIYFAYQEGKMVRNSNSINLEIEISMYSGGGAPVPGPGQFPGGPQPGPGNIEGPGMPPEMGRPPDMSRPPEMMGPNPTPEMVPGPTPMQQTGQMKITGTLTSDMILVD